MSNFIEFGNDSYLNTDYVIDIQKSCKDDKPCIIFNTIIGERILYYEDSTKRDTSFILLYKILH